MRKPTIHDVKVGDIVICHDEYSHDYEEHEFRVTSIEKDPEYATEGDSEGIRLYGEDLSSMEDGEYIGDEYIGNIHIGNFVTIKDWE